MRLLVIALFISHFSLAQTVQQETFDDLQKGVLNMKDSIVVLNFWATWCKPCIEELPAFEELNKKHASKKVKVILVNLDFNSKIKTQVEPFVKAKNLKSEIRHITDTDPNTWINKIDSSWSGAIPATVIYGQSGNKIKFHEGQLSLSELEKLIEPYLEK